MLTLDGSIGEGGGQILRTALGLSMVTGAPFRIRNIRANRSMPGLLRQHLTAVQAATQVSSARVNGAAPGSRELEFIPGEVQASNFDLAVGTAGSTTLVLQTVLPALMSAPGPSTITIEGGTHNTHAPSVRFLTNALLPLLARMGPQVHVDIERYGFYPAGGGRICARIEPVKHLEPFELLDRGSMLERLAVASISMLPADIAKRELAVVGKQLDWPEESLRIDQIKRGFGPGNILSLEIRSENVTEVFTGFGEKSVPAEQVSAGAVELVRSYLGYGQPVGPHLADQLMLPLALAGGRFRTGPLSSHAQSNMQVINTFLPDGVAVDEVAPNVNEIRAAI